MKIQKRKNILVIVDDINVDNSSGARANLSLIQNLSIYHSLTALHYSNIPLEIDNIKTIFINENKFSVYYLLSRLNRLIRRVSGKNFGRYYEMRFGLSLTFKNDLVSIKKKISQEYLNLDFDLIFTLSQGESYLPHFSLLSFPQIHKKWISYIHDPYPVNYYPKSFAYDAPGRIKKADLMASVMAKSKFILFPSLILSQWMQKYYGFDLNKVKIVPHQINNFVVEQTERKYILDLFRHYKFVLLHAGNLLDQRDPCALIEAFINFRQTIGHEKKEVAMVLVGPISDRVSESIKKYASIQSLHIITKKIPFHDALIFQRRASVNIVLESCDEISPFLPGKVPHCIASNKPILLLGPAISETRRILGQDYPYYSHPKNVLMIQKCIQQLYVERNSRNDQYSKNLRQYFEHPEMSRVFDTLFK